MPKHKKPTFWSQYQPTSLAMSLVVLMIFATSFAIGLKLEGMRGGLLIAQLDNCGNGQIDEGEDCDDGNTNNYDGCSSRCLVESKSPLYPEDVVAPLMQMRTEYSAQPVAPTPAPTPKPVAPKPVAPKKVIPKAQPIAQPAPKPEQPAALVLPESTTNSDLRGVAPKSVMMQETVTAKSQLDEKYLQQKMHGVPREEKMENAMQWRDEDLLFMFLVLTFFVLTLVAHLLLYSMNKTQNALLKQKMDHIAHSSRSKLRIATKKRK